MTCERRHTLYKWVSSSKQIRTRHGRFLLEFFVFSLRFIRFIASVFRFFASAFSFFHFGFSFFFASGFVLSFCFRVDIPFFSRHVCHFSRRVRRFFFQSSLSFYRVTNFVFSLHRSCSGPMQCIDNFINSIKRKSTKSVLCSQGITRQLLVHFAHASVTKYPTRVAASDSPAPRNRLQLGPVWPPPNAHTSRPSRYT